MRLEDLSNLAHRAFRRPPTPQDIDAPLAFYRSARQNGDFEFAIREALPAILASPKFLYRTELTPRTVKAGVAHRISDLELASRLSFFLTARAPDEQLLAAAEKNTLAQPKALEAQVRRLLADPRSQSLVTTFAFQWLKLRALDDADPDAILFPNFDDEPARGLQARSRAVRAERVQGRSQRARSADARTTRSSTSGWRFTTAFPTYEGPGSAASCSAIRIDSGCSAREGC